MRSPHGFIKTAGRGSAYCTQGGRHWIIKTGSKWHLLQMGHEGEGRERKSLGVFPTLRDAGEFFRTHIQATLPPYAKVGVKREEAP